MSTHEPIRDNDNVIPIGTGGRPGRGSGRKRPSSAARGLAGNRAADRKSAQQQETGQPKAGKLKTGRPKAPKAASASAKATKTPVPANTAPASTGTAKTATKRVRKAPPPKQASSTARAAATTHDRGAVPGVGAAEWRRAIETGAFEVFGPDWERQLAHAVAYLRRRVTGDYAVDEFGFDPELTERFLMAVLRPIAQKWFRIEVRGLENIPIEGGALVVSNHSGTVPVDGMMTMSAIFDATGRHLRPLGADLVFKMPVVSAVARATGATLACNEDAERMLRGGELVGVWPEGFKGIGKPFSERYKLQRFGRGGFVSAALRTKVPIIPLSVVGAEEIYPLVANLPTLARLLGIPYVPITPFFPLLGPLGLVPLPSKWLMEFGEPIRTDAFDDVAADDPMLVFDVTDQVRETIQQTLFELLKDRTSVFG
ncbi:MAG: lysophospholipid acyltransferase family protein [Nocardioides sp.]|jgi:1-acyl-sn-glycerol-3-phosphate acyltransferase